MNTNLTVANFRKKGSSRIARVDGGAYVMSETSLDGTEWRGQYVSDDGSIIDFGLGTRSSLIAAFNAYEAAVGF